MTEFQPPQPLYTIALIDRHGNLKGFLGSHGATAFGPAKARKFTQAADAFCVPADTWSEHLIWLVYPEILGVPLGVREVI